MLFGHKAKRKAKIKALLGASKENLHGNLNDPGIARGSDPAKSRVPETRLPETITTAAPARKHLPLSVVERVEELKTGLQRNALAKPVVLLDGDIPVVKARRPKNIAPAIPRCE